MSPSRPFFIVAAGVAAALVLGGTLAARSSFAADHEDAPSLVTDPGTDITDVHAFMRPDSSTHMVLSMTVHPNATSTTKFEPGVEYVFRALGYDPSAVGVGGAIDPTLDAKISCRFLDPGAGVEDAGGSGAPPQHFICSANGFSTIGDVESLDAGSPNADIRVFAGLRADPAFGDVAALKQTLATSQLAFNDAGGAVNTFAGKNVLAIVVEVNVDKVLLATIDGGGGGAPRPLLAVSAMTERP